MDPDVLVVGAGPNGLALACSLAAAKVPVRLVDRAAEPASTSRANILHARGVEVLDRLGALDGIREQAHAPQGMAMHVQGRPPMTMRFAPIDGETTQALFVSQAAIEHALRTRLSGLGVEVEWGTELTDLEQDTEGVTAHAATGGPIRSGWIVGCDGTHSRVRELAGVEFPGVPVVEQFLLADVYVRWDRDRATSAGWFHRDGILLALPMRTNSERASADGTLWRLMADVPASAADGPNRSATPEQIVERLARIVPERSGDHGMEVVEAIWTSVFRIHRRLAADYRSGRVLLAGDAAHIHSPIGGQGINTGIGDAENLGWKLALVTHGRADQRLLDTYAAERRPLATTVLDNTTAQTKILVGGSSITRLLRDHLFIPLLGMPAVQRFGTKTASQLWVSYRKGPLGGRSAGRGEPRRGDRLRDRQCVRPDGTTTRLYADLGPPWVLLVPPGEKAGELATTVGDHLGEPVVVLHPENPGRRSVAMLVRPDGHLGWQGDIDGSGDLERWLTGVLHCEKVSG